MRIVLRKPTERLRPFVERYLGAELAGVEAGVHRSLPSPYLTFIISLDEPIEVVHPPEHHGRRLSPAVIGGLQTAAISVRHGTSLRLIRVLLSPLGARSIFGVRAAEIASAVFDLHQVMGSCGDELIERLGGAETWSERFDVLDDVLVSGLDDRDFVPSPLDRAWRNIAATGGTLRVGGLGREVGFSRRHLTERFGREFGLTPKIAARVVRLDRARRLLQTTGESLSSVAAACAFTDQAHLTREWRELTGVTPAVWIAAEHLPNLQDAADPLLAQ